MRLCAAAAVGAGGLAMLLLLLPGGDDAGVAPPRAADHRLETGMTPSPHHAQTLVAPRSAGARAAERSAATIARAADPAREPAFELSALVAHDDARAVAELVRNGSLDPRALVDRILAPGAAEGERGLLIDALVQAQTPAAQAALITLSLDPLLEAGLTEQAYDGLGRSLRPTESTLAHLRRMRFDARRVHRAAATRALGVLAREASDAALRSTLTRGLLSDLREAREPDRRVELIAGVAQTASPEARGVLARLTDAARPQVRALAGEGLGRIPGVEAEVMLLTLLEEGLAGDRAVAATALAGRTPTVETVGALCDAATHDRADPVRLTAIAALSSWASRRDLPAASQRRIRVTLERLAGGEGASAESARAAIAPKG